MSSAFRSSLIEGYLGNLLNPKAAAVYLTIAPQFLNPAGQLFAQIMILCTTHIAIAVTWLLIWARVVNRGRHLVEVGRMRNTLTRVTGVVLIVLGLHAAVATN